MTVFVDDDGKAYLFHASEDNRTMHISLLTDDYVKPAGKYKRIFEGRCMEAPAVFKFEGKYYLVGSDCTGWKPNPQRSAVAESIWGPWKELGNPCIGPNANLTFLAQSNYVLPVAGKKGAFIWMGDRWHPENQIDSRYVWLPIRFAKERFVISWMDRWELSYFNKLRRLGEDPPEEAWAAGKAQAPELRLTEEDMRWWRDVKFGMFIHWGLCAIPGEGEWGMYEKYLKNGLPANDYLQLAREFKGAKFDAGEWVRVAKDAGMKYMVMVARHHDGFALWSSQASENGFTSASTAARRDFVKEYVEAARKAGMRTGLYYSPMDWRFPGVFSSQGEGEELAAHEGSGLWASSGVDEPVWTDRHPLV